MYGEITDNSGDYTITVNSGATIENTNDDAIYTYGGNVVINGGTVKTTGSGIPAIVMLDGGIVTLNSGTVESSSYYAISGKSSSTWSYSKRGEVVQKGGTITGGVQCGIMTMGTNDSSVSTTAPVVQSSYQYGANVNTLNFYDGKITGLSSSGAYTASSKTNTPTGYAIVINTSVAPYATATLTTGYYSVTTSGATQGATTLSNALSLAADSGSTITMLANRSEGATTINKSLTFNTNGKTLSMTGALVFTGGKTITINGNGTIKSTLTSSSAYDTMRVEESTTVNLQSSALTKDGDKFVLQVRGNSILNMSGGSIRGLDASGGIVNISGGTITGTGYIANNSSTSAAIQTDGGCKLNISSGTITATSGQAYAIYCSGYLTMTGGTVTGGKIGIELGSRESKITGGTITGEDYGVYGTYNLTIGTDDSTISTTSPSITSTNGYGVRVDYPQYGFAFYDGVIKGKSTSGALYKNPATMPTGASLYKTTSNGVETCILKK